MIISKSTSNTSKNTSKFTSKTNWIRLAQGPREFQYSKAHGCMAEGQVLQGPWVLALVWHQPFVCQLGVGPEAPMAPLGPGGYTLERLPLGGRVDLSPPLACFPLGYSPDGPPNLGSIAGHSITEFYRLFGLSWETSSHSRVLFTWATCLHICFFFQKSSSGETLN